MRRSRQEFSTSSSPKNVREDFFKDFSRFSIPICKRKRRVFGFSDVYYTSRIDEKLEIYLFKKKKINNLLKSTKFEDKPS